MSQNASNLSTKRRDVIVAFRLTGTEAANVDIAATSLKRPRTRGDYCRAAVLHVTRQRVPYPVSPPRLPPRRIPAADTQLLARILAETGRLADRLQDIRDASCPPGTSATEDLRDALVDVSALRAAVVDALGGAAGEVSS